MVGPSSEDSDSVNFDKPFDYRPLEKSMVRRIEERVFSLFRGKERAPTRTERVRAGVIPKKENVLEGGSSVFTPTEYQNVLRQERNCIPIQEKSLAEKVRDQIRFPQITKTASAIGGISLVVFAVGAFMIYSEIPTHPDLVIGIILVTLAGNVIMNNR